MLLTLLLFGRAAPCHAALSYDVKLEGVDDGALRSDLEAVSDTLRWKDKPPATLGILNRRAADDLPRMLGVLHSAGYYGAEVRFELDRDREPPLVTFTVNPEARFQLESITITVEGEGCGLESKLPSPDALGLRAAVRPSPPGFSTAKSSSSMP